MRQSLISCCLLHTSYCLLITASSATSAQDEVSRYAAGLLAEFDANNKKFRRIDEDILFDWGSDSPDSRIGSADFRVRWQGRLFVRRSSTYSLRVHVAGRVKLRLGSETILTGEKESAGWLTSEPIELSFGYHPLVIDYVKRYKKSRIALFWESKFFDLEPVPARNLVHVPPPLDYGLGQRGESLVLAHRCDACHSIPLEGTDLRAPSLAKLKGAVHEDWLIEYLCQPAKGGRRVRMPDFGLDDQQVRSVSAYLLSQRPSVSLSKNPRKGEPEKGKRLNQQLGCLACHTIDGMGKDPLFGGGDLTSIARKRPAGFFGRWLTEPADLNPHHRMPVFDLSKKEVAALSAYLATLGDRGTKVEKGNGLGIRTGSNTALAKSGRQIILEKRCASCHEIPGIEAPAPLPWNSKIFLSSQRPGCMADPKPENHQPGYRFSEADRAAIVEFLGSLPSKKAVLSPFVAGKRILKQKNCTSCHARGNAVGLREVATKLGITDPKIQATLIPPTLDSVGDKLHPKWLKSAVMGKAKRLRPWLAPRMPRFYRTEQETDLLVEYLTRHDRMPETERSEQKFSDRPAMLLAAHRLVSSTGFGCMSCHTIGTYEPVGVEPGARGSDLRFIADRMRPSWFRRFSRDPARITAGVEMPAILLAVPGVLGGKIDHQLEALWQGLNAPIFDLPSSNAVQVLTATDSDRAIILRDPMEFDIGVHTTRPFAVGLPGGHNFLFDLDDFSFRRWWIGDFARQRVRRKTWFWETAGITLLDFPDAPSMIALIKNEKILEPKADGQAVGWLEEFGHFSAGASAGASFRYRLNFEEGFSILVEMTLNPDGDGASLTLIVEQVPEGYEPVFRKPRGTNLDTDQFETPVGSVRIQSKIRGGNFRGEKLTPLRRQGDRWQIALHFSSESPPPKNTSKAKLPPVRQKQKKYPVLPGYEVVRLPVPDGPMPTCIAFRPDGVMVVGSLKGGIYLVEDTDGDGLQDSYRLFSDHLSAPYGLMIDGNDVIVSHKHELLRLIDKDRDGRAERTKVISTGWGVTFDYHDWAVGLIRDESGNFFVSPSCQQDDRPLEAVIGRGKVLEIDPAGRNRFDVFASGIRFAMGFAIDPAGNIFATDNQGDSNPFNELNHIRRGHHYGFWNKLEPHSEDQKITLPAIQIPHPWTGSVNGIAFVPPGGSFGPFAGQLIGVDYRTRKLIRMSLQRVGETFQGCAYPFSNVDPKLIEEDRTFLGPIALAFGPAGSLYVGSVLDSGWGGGNDRGAIEKVRHTGPLPFGIREVRAHAGGFDLDFLGLSDPQLAADPDQYTLSCYQRIYQGGYHTPDQDRTSVTVERVDVSPDARSVRLYAKPLRPTFVYDIAIGTIGAGARKPHPAVAYYTLNQIPKE